MRPAKEISKLRTSENQRGVALLTVMLLLLILTVLGVAAIAVTGLETRMAGFSSSTEASAAAAESCAGAGVNIIAQTLDLGAVPTQYVVGGAGATSPVVPAAAENSAAPPTLTQEIYAQADNNPDKAFGSGASPDLQFNVGSYAVAGDIDRLYITQKAGSGLQYAGGYGGLGEGGGGAEDVFYRIDCQAANIATGTTNRVVVVYACLKTGETCQKKSF
jgi:Tfp pilus assembly protein PilX